MVVSPEKMLEAWLLTLPVQQRQVLCRWYVFLTSRDSREFSLTGEESYQLFIARLTAVDFAARRVARLVMIRAVFSFILNHSFGPDYQPGGVSATAMAREVSQISHYQWLRAAKQWQDLCAGALDDGALSAWLQRMEDADAP